MMAMNQINKTKLCYRNINIEQAFWKWFVLHPRSAFVAIFHFSNAFIFDDECGEFEGHWLLLERKILLV